MVMSGSFHLDNICDFGQFNIFSQNLVVNFISWDADSLLRDRQFWHIKILNPQGRKFNLIIELQSLHPTSSIYLFCNVEIKSGLNECEIFWSNLPFASSIEKFNLHKNVDCGQPADLAYDMDLSLIRLSCQSLLKGCFHDPIADSLEKSYYSGLVSHVLYLHAFNQVLYGCEPISSCCGRFFHPVKKFYAIVIALFVFICQCRCLCCLSLSLQCSLLWFYTITYFGPKVGRSFYGCNGCSISHDLTMYYLF